MINSSRLTLQSILQLSGLRLEETIPVKILHCCVITQIAIKHHSKQLRLVAFHAMVSAFIPFVVNQTGKNSLRMVIEGKSFRGVPKGN